MDSEKSIEQYLVKRTKGIGGKAYKFVSPGNAGVPDRIVIFPNGRVAFVELKCAAGKISAAQKNQIAKLKALNQTVRVIYSKDEVDNLIAEFGGTE